MVEKVEDKEFERIQATGKYVVLKCVKIVEKESVIKTAGGIIIPANVVRLFFAIMALIIFLLIISLICCVASGACSRTVANFLLLLLSAGIAWC